MGLLSSVSFMLRVRFLQAKLEAILEPAMNLMLVVALMIACAVNMGCLFGHL